MIARTNPLHITCITWKPFYRKGYHPLYLRLVRKRSWWRAWLVKHWVGNGRENYYVFDDFVRSPCVVIEGQHRIIKVINCHSNDRARQLWAELNDQLDDFYGELAVLEKLREGL